MPFPRDIRQPLLRSILAALLLAACGLALRAEEPAAKPDTPKPDLPKFENEIRAFEAWDHKNSVPKNAFLFVGSSSVRLWQTAEGFPDLPVINRGFGGSTIADVNRYAERIVVKYAPHVIVFYAGDNDLAAGRSAQQVFDDFQAFVRIAHDRLPATPIVFVSIKPSPARWKKWPEMQAANALVQQFANSVDSNVIYVDVTAPMLGNDGQPRREIFRDDGLHMNDAGYKIWNDILTPVLGKFVEKP